MSNHLPRPAKRSFAKRRRATLVCEALEDRVMPSFIEVLETTAATYSTHATIVSGQLDEEGLNRPDQTASIDNEGQPIPPGQLPPGESSGVVLQSVKATQDGAIGATTAAIGLDASPDTAPYTGSALLGIRGSFIAGHGFEGGSVSGSFEGGSGLGHDDPITLRIAGGEGEADGAPVLITLVASSSMNILVGGNYRGSFIVGYNTIEGEPVQLLEGTFQSAASSSRSATFKAKIGDTFQVHFFSKGEASGNVGFVHGLDLTVNINPGPNVDLIADSMEWDTAQGGLTFQYKIDGGDLPEGQTAQVELFWAKGGTTMTSITLPATFTPQNKAGTYTVNVPGSALRNAPEGADQLKLVLDREGAVPGSALRNAPEGADQLKFVLNRGAGVAEPKEDNNTSTLADVKITLETTAKGTLTEHSKKIISELLREAGQATALVTSLERTPEDQARIMFDNCLNKGVASQLKLYAAAGDTVVKVYQSKTKGLARNKILARRATIQKAMLDQIKKIGPQKVSRHCADSNVQQVIDLAPSSFSKATETRFRQAAERAVQGGGVSKLLTPSNGDPAYHLEISQPLPPPPPLP